MILTLVLSSLGARFVIGHLATRIIHGDDAGEGEYPFIVALAFPVLNALVRICTGTLISQTWSLTAGHCVRETAPQEGGRILYGNLTILPNMTTTFKHILLVKKLPNYMLFRDRVNARSDIALLKTEPIEMKTFGKVSAVDYKSLIGAPVRYVGAGSTISPELLKKSSKKQISLHVYNDQMRPLQIGTAVVVKCSDQDFLRNAFICLAPKCSNKKQKVQYGDSGGPLLHKGKVVGLATSYIGQYNYFGVKIHSNEMLYTPVSIFLNWIQDNVD